MKKLMIAKQGFFFRLMSASLQMITFSPVSFLISFVFTTVISSVVNIENVLLLFKIIFLLCEILWIIRNSIVIVLCSMHTFMQTLWYSD